MDKEHINYLMLYKKPISESILEYATDNFTKSNARHLVDLDENENKNELLIVIKDLIEWYKTNLDMIKKDRFVFKKSDHVISYNLLVNIEKQLLYKQWINL